MGISLIFLSLTYFIQPPFFHHLVMLLLATYIIGYQTGFGPVTWLLLSEIFPLKERARTASICTLTNFCANWVVLFGFDFVRVWCGDSLQYAIYAVLALLGVVFVYLKVPETKGLTLEDITKRFSAM
mmetsp:Transcript_25015/g.98843  ORF Transcript_25015/g.98843 Transcript_25015/m.98843 type:complete len:127 (+) Transcript_25015:1167-1547(+)